MRWRTLHIDGIEWRYHIGRGTVVIRNPDGLNTHHINAATIKGNSEDAFERGKWKQTSDGMIFPGEVKAFIKRELIK